MRTAWMLMLVMAWVPGAAPTRAADPAAASIVLAEEPDVFREPRVKASPEAPLGSPLHPFLWAGYMLVDCGGGRYAVEPPPAAPLANPPAARP